jgi:hypothetical protein
VSALLRDGDISPALLAQPRGRREAALDRAVAALHSARGALLRRLSAAAPPRAVPALKPHEHPEIVAIDRALDDIATLREGTPREGTPP